MSVRKVIFWLHLLCGIAAGIIILVMSVTGVALTYQKQMTAWADKRACRMQVPANAVPLSAEALIARYRQTMPEALPVSLSLSSDRSMPASLTLASNEMAFVNPYTGELLGSGARGTRQFFKAMTDLHRWLALSGESRKTGKAITGAANFIFLFLALSGLYLWWPRQWTAAIVRAIAWFRGRLPGRARDSNWHNVFGFWCLIPLILIIVSGIVISYPWASKLVFRLAGSQMTLPAGPPGHRGGPPTAGRGGPAAPRAPLQLEGLDRMIATVRKNSAVWKSLSFPLPTLADKSVAFAVDAGSGGQPQLRSTITVDRASGSILRSEGFGDMDSGLRARVWLRFVHTGEYYGLAGQTIAGIASLAGIILVWTGIALSFRRYAAWLRKTGGVRSAGDC